MIDKNIKRQSESTQLSRAFTVKYGSLLQPPKKKKKKVSHNFAIASLRLIIARYKLTNVSYKVRIMWYKLTIVKKNQNCEIQTQLRKTESLYLTIPTIFLSYEYTTRNSDFIICK